MQHHCARTLFLGSYHQFQLLKSPILAGRALLFSPLFVIYITLPLEIFSIWFDPISVCEITCYKSETLQTSGIYSSFFFRCPFVFLRGSWLVSIVLRDQNTIVVNKVGIYGWQRFNKVMMAKRILSSLFLHTYRGTQGEKSWTFCSWWN